MAVIIIFKLVGKAHYMTDALKYVKQTYYAVITTTIRCPFACRSMSIRRPFDGVRLLIKKVIKVTVP